MATTRQLFEYISPEQSKVQLIESADGKELFMQGLFIQGDVKNQNGSGPQPMTIHDDILPADYRDTRDECCFYFLPTRCKFKTDPTII